MNISLAGVVAELAFQRVEKLHDESIHARINHQFATADKYSADIAKMQAEAELLQKELDRVSAFEKAVEKVTRLREKLRDALENIAWLKAEIAESKRRAVLPRVY